MAPLIGNECFPVSVTKEITIADSPVFIHLGGEDGLHDQLQEDIIDSTVERSDDLLITSPYDEISHLLDLKTLEVPSRLLAKALTILEPIREDYAIAPYTESFNWQGIVDYLRNLANEEGYQWPKSEFFLVAFRSRLNLHVDLQRLYELDMRSHEEATVSGGLLKYWYGTRNENGENLATCRFLLSFTLTLLFCSERPSNHKQVSGGA
jgi:hypothetical protein